MSKTITDANFVSTASTAHQSYLDVIPSVIINWNFDASSGINLGFTQRIKRPGINQLNPFIDRSNPDFQSSGNPALQRVLFNSAQLDYHLSKKTAVNIGVDYNSIKGLDLRVSTFNPATNITYTTSQNTGQVTALGTFINISYPITKQWNFSLNGNIRYYWLSGPVNGVQQNVDFFLGNAAFSTGYTLDKGWRLNVNVDINSRNPTGLQGSSSNGFTSTAFSINKQIIKNRLSFSASVRNPFTKYRNNRMETFGPDFTQTMLNQVYFRSYSVSLNYSFGKLKDGIKKNKRGINNDDISK